MYVASAPFNHFHPCIYHLEWWIHPFINEAKLKINSQTKEVLPPFISEFILDSAFEKGTGINILSIIIS